jgi:hypothetical protein
VDSTSRFDNDESSTDGRHRHYVPWSGYLLPETPLPPLSAAQISSSSIGNLGLIDERFRRPAAA